MEYCHFSWEEAWDLPIEYRRWFIERKQKENERVKEANEKAAKGRKQSSPPPRKPLPPRRP